MEIIDNKIVVQGKISFDSFEDFFAFEEEVKEAKKMAKKGMELIIKDVSPVQKFRSTKVYVSGKNYDSKAEVYRHYELLQDKSIKDLRYHDKNDKIVLLDFPKVNYIPDFVYIDEDGYEVIEDVKGFETKDFILKKKMLINLIHHSERPLKLVLTAKRAKGFVVKEVYCKDFQTKKY